MDEPFSALDYQTRLAVSDDVYNIIKKEKKSAIMVTHDIAEAISMADKVIVLTKRPSTIKNIIDNNDDNFNFGHANDMTYNPNTDYVYISIFIEF